MRDRDSSNTGSVADTSYDAHGSDRYTTGEPRKGPGMNPGVNPDVDPGARQVGESIPADPDTTSSDEP